LTSTERRVADLVAAGRTNAEVAAELFMSQRTVESHLSRIYRKLDIRSRTELSRALTPRITLPSETSPTAGLYKPGVQSVDHS
jgi:DNA-binding CsgD family transcriptional regulator